MERALQLYLGGARAGNGLGGVEQKQHDIRFVHRRGVGEPE
jgi:hypothetical protein